MKDIGEELAELAALAQMHLFQNFKLADKLLTEPETHSFFLEFAQTAKEPKRVPPPAPLKSTAPAPARPLPAPKVTPPKHESAPQNEIKEKAPPNILTIERQKGKEGDTANFSDIHKIIAAHFPSLRLMADIPSDEQAIKVAEGWNKKKNAEAIVVSPSNPSPREYTFLTQIVTAIERTFCTAELVSDQETFNAYLKEPALRVVMAPQKLVEELNLPLPIITIGLPPTHVLLSTPALKRKLWQEIQSVFSNH